MYGGVANTLKVELETWQEDILYTCSITIFSVNPALSQKTDSCLTPLSWCESPESPRHQESKSLPGPDRDDICWNMPQSGGRTCQYHIQWLGMKPTRVEVWGHRPTSKILTQNCSCLKYIQGQRVEQRLKERPPRDCPTWGSIPYTVIKPRHYCGWQEVLADRSLI